MRKERAAPGLVSSLLNQPPLLSRSAVLSSLAEPSTNCSTQPHLAQGQMSFFSTSMSDAKRSLLYMPFDGVLPASYADWHKVSCESVSMLMTNARCSAFELMLHSCTASLRKQEGYGVITFSSPAVVLGTKQPIFVPHHNDHYDILWQPPLTFCAWIVKLRHMPGHERMFEKPLG